MCHLKPINPSFNKRQKKQTMERPRRPFLRKIFQDQDIESDLARSDIDLSEDDDDDVLDPSYKPTNDERNEPIFADFESDEGDLDHQGQSDEFIFDQRASPVSLGLPSTLTPTNIPSPSTEVSLSSTDAFSSPNTDGVLREESHNTEVPLVPVGGRIMLRGRSMQRGRNIRRGQNSQRGQNIQRGRQVRYNASSTNISWKNGEFPPKHFALVEPAYLLNDTTSLDCLGYLYQYIDEEFISIIVEKTNQTAIKNTGRSLNLDVKECMVYIGITLIMASVNYPHIRMYWQKKWRVSMITEHMPRNRFEQLRNSLKIVFDDDISQDDRRKDKLWKVRPLVKRILKGCHIQSKAKELSIDEMIIPFTGSCGLKQYCPGKPNPVGLKAFVLANPNGLICDFHVYEGDTTFKEGINSEFGVAAKSVLQLAEHLVPGHILYFDRYFTTEKLACELLKRGIGCTGTIVRNRVPPSAKRMLKEDKDMKTEGRGSSHVMVREDNACAIVQWFDNKSVTLMSTVEAIEHEDTCRRWCKQTKTYLTIKRPRAVREYNLKMGGVDLADRMLAVAPFRHRTKKWTQRFVSHMVDLAVVNSWIQYKNDAVTKKIPRKKIMKLRSFKLEIGELLIEKYNGRSESTTDSAEEIEHTMPAKRSKGKPKVELPSQKKRLDGAKHMPYIEKTQQKCRHCHVNKTRVRCGYCNIYLCLTADRNCYSNFHK